MLAAVSVRAEAAPPTWADVVGEYRGRLAWKGCNTPGAKQATVALDATDGALAIDLTPARGGLRAFSLVLDDDATSAWSGQDADVEVHVSRARANVLSLVVAIGDRCEVRGTLTRVTTSVEACDRVVAWSRIEQRCTKRTGPPLEDGKALVLERAVWTRLPKGKAAMSCSARADTLATALIDAGCAPVDDPAALQPPPSCLRLRELTARVARCTSAPPQLVQLAQSLATLAVPVPDAPSRAIASETCDEALALLGQRARQARCAP